MARPTKVGLDYFPFDVDFATNDKTEAIMGEFGPKGVLIFIYLLSAIYRKGYYLQWTELVKNQLANRVKGATGELVSRVLYRLVAYGTFDKVLFNSAEVITSQRIQQTYLDATKRRKSQIPTKYWINVDINVSNNVVNVDINTQSKVNKIKVNKIKTKNIKKEKDVVVNADLKKVTDCYSNNIHPVTGEIELQQLKDWTQSVSADVVIKAIDVAVKANKRSLSYIKGILNNWQTNGINAYNNSRHHDKPAVPRGVQELNDIINGVS